MYNSILFNNTDGVVRISLNRPQVHHALNSELIGEITKAIKEAEADETVRVVVLTAEGNKAFCSGADLKANMESGKSVGDSLREFYNPMILAIRNIPKPVICRLNGLAAGAGRVADWQAGAGSRAGAAGARPWRGSAARIRFRR